MDHTKMNGSFEVVKKKGKYIDTSKKDYELALPELTRLSDEAEANGENPYHVFDDAQIMQHYLYRQTHIDHTKGKSLKTIDTYNKVLKQFIYNLTNSPYKEQLNLDLVPVPHLNAYSLFKGLGKRHLRRYQEWLAKESPYVMENGPYSAASISQKTLILKRFFKQLYLWNYISEPIYEGFYSVSISKDERPNRDASTADVLFLLRMFEDLMNVKMFTFVHILTTTGIRNAEFCSMKVGDIKKDRLTSTYYLDIIAKGNKRRQIPLRDKTLKAIELYRLSYGFPSIYEADTEQPIFMTGRGKAYTPSHFSELFTKEIDKLPDLQKQLVDARFRINEKEVIKITPHLFRHAYAIISHENGADVYDIMRSLGHERIDTTMIYLDKIMKQEKNAIHKWDSKAFEGYL